MNKWVDVKQQKQLGIARQMEQDYFIGVVDTLIIILGIIFTTWAVLA